MLTLVEQLMHEKAASDACARKQRVPPAHTVMSLKQAKKHCTGGRRKEEKTKGKREKQREYDYENLSDKII